MQPLKRNCIALNQELQNPERSYKALKQGKKEKRRKKEKIPLKKRNFFPNLFKELQSPQARTTREKGKREKKILTP